MVNFSSRASSFATKVSDLAHKPPGNIVQKASDFKDDAAFRTSLGLQKVRIKAGDFGENCDAVRHNIAVTPKVLYTKFIKGESAKFMYRGFTEGRRNEQDIELAKHMTKDY